MVLVENGRIELFMKYQIVDKLATHRVGSLNYCLYPCRLMVLIYTINMGYIRSVLPKKERTGYDRNATYYGVAGADPYILC